MWAWRCARLDGGRAGYCARALSADSLAATVGRLPARAIAVPEALGEAVPGVGAGFYAVVEDGRMLDYFALMNWLRSAAGPQDVVMAYEHRLLHYLTRLPTVHFRRGYAKARPGRSVKDVRRAGVTYGVHDHEKGTAAALYERLLASYPGAFERVATFGALDLFRVRGAEHAGDQRGAADGS